jgi:ribonuclease E
MDGNSQGDAPRNENGEPREKRQRDRYGRERGPRGERGEREERPDLRVPALAAAESAADSAAVAIAQAMAPSDATATVAAVVAAPVAAPAAPAPAAPSRAAAPAAAGMPKVTPYTLPTDALLDVAQQSGLQWVNSDADKVQAVQAAIAAEPKPIHVPRERPAPVVMDTGPLVLVETKRDLRNMTLPFEQAPTA